MTGVKVTELPMALGLQVATAAPPVGPEVTAQVSPETEPVVVTDSATPVPALVVAAPGQITEPAQPSSISPLQLLSTPSHTSGVHARQVPRPSHWAPGVGVQR